MAYLTHSAYQVKSSSARSSHIALVAGAAVTAVLTVGFYAAVFHGGAWFTAESAASKGDRSTMIASSAHASVVGSPTHAGGVQTMTDDAGRVVFLQDQAQRTTTVMRGATIPLSGESPYPGAK